MTEAATSNAVNPDVEHQKELAQKWIAKATDLEKQLERFKNVDVEEYRAIKEEVSSLRKENAGADPKKIEEVIAKERAALEKDFNNRFGKKYEELESGLKSRDAELSKLRVINPAMLKAAEHFNSTELTLIQMLVEKDLTYSEGSILVKGTDGKPKSSIKDPRNVMGLDEYFETLATQYPGCAKAKSVGGSKTSGAVSSAANSSNGGISVDKYKSMTPQERLSIPIAERGKLAALSLNS